MLSIEGAKPTICLNSFRHLARAATNRKLTFHLSYHLNPAVIPSPSDFQAHLSRKLQSFSCFPQHFMRRETWVHTASITKNHIGKYFLSLRTPLPEGPSTGLRNVVILSTSQDTRLSVNCISHLHDLRIILVSPRSQSDVLYAVNSHLVWMLYIIYYILDYRRTAVNLLPRCWSPS